MSAAPQAPRERVYLWLLLVPAALLGRQLIAPPQPAPVPVATPRPTPTQAAGRQLYPSTHRWALVQRLWLAGQVPGEARALLESPAQAWKPAPGLDHALLLALLGEHVPATSATPAAQAAPQQAGSPGTTPAAVLRGKDAGPVPPPKPPANGAIQAVADYLRAHPGLRASALQERLAFWCREQRARKLPAGAALPTCPTDAAVRLTRAADGSLHCSLEADATHAVTDGGLPLAILESRVAARKADVAFLARLPRPPLWGSKVAVLGASSTDLVTPLASLIRPGRLYAVDRSPLALDLISFRAERLKQANVARRLESPMNVHLPAAGVDLIVSSEQPDSWLRPQEHFNRHYTESLCRALRPDGRLVVVFPAAARVDLASWAAKLRPYGLRLQVAESRGGTPKQRRLYAVLALSGTSGIPRASKAPEPKSRP